MIIIFLPEEYCLQEMAGLVGFSISFKKQSVIISLRSCMINRLKALLLDFVSPTGVRWTQKPCAGNLLGSKGLILGFCYAIFLCED